MTDRLRPRPAGTWTTDEVRQRVVHAYTVRQLSIRGIADTIGANYTTVHAILTNAQVRLRPRGARPSAQTQTPTEPEAGTSRQDRSR
ncbi:hypothetical protein COUCH_14555 [Couchioplanes caeruleus]|uniref:helix-turn-helix domain-containing protein n=1 Tax=Couchioplanes caeruleus TaxID=56438 RepID=UPI0020BE72CA|nr:hypothetical protein [Couchioplanes caeruleus]UQU67410.1 hypothetical protein COUCH_14555 [Couchioplanes caeruleus]